MCTDVQSTSALAVILFTMCLQSHRFIFKSKSGETLEDQSDLSN